MKIKIMFLLAFTTLALSGCGMLGANDEINTTANAGNAENKETASNDKPKSEKTPEFTGEVTFPWEDYPATETTAKQGEHVLVPSYNWLVETMTEKGDNTMIWYAQKMAKPGPEKSEVQFMSETKTVPNQYIVPIPAGAQAKKGDILLSWWQSGSGMRRAIVTDASDPRAPKVKYLDSGWTEKSPGTLSTKNDTFKPDTFRIINKEMEPGTSVAIQKGADQIHGEVINVAGDKIYVRLFAGKTGVFPKADATPVPVRPNVKTGDRVKVPFTSKFSPATVTKVDQENGHVWVKYDSGKPDETAIAFGDVLPAT